MKSLIGRLDVHKDCVRSLGLRRLHQSVVIDDIPTMRGMVNKVCYLLKVEELA
jgi:large subunit ribosomal protein L30